MSSTSSVSPSSTSVLPTTSETPTSSGSSSNSSANYFFGFLITFIVLLLIFVGCGIGSRRGFRFTGTGGGSVWDEAVGRARIAEKQTQPIFWETWLKGIGGKDSWSWDTIMPISATFIRAESLIQEDILSPSDNDGSSSILDRPLSAQGFRTRSRTLRSLFSRSHNREKPTSTDHPPGAIQVSVMVAMPSAARPPYTLGDAGSSRGSCDPAISEFGEFQIGTARIPWEDGELNDS